MAGQWYFAWANTTFGPFSAAQLRELALQGRLQPADTVWKDGSDRRVLAAKIKNLFPTLQAEAFPVTTPEANKHLSLGIEPSSVPESGNKLDSWVPSPNDRATSGKMLQEIPDGLTLRALAGRNEPAFPAH